MVNLPCNTRPLEQQIVRLLLKQLKEATEAEYPRTLYVPRRDAYIAQIETVNTKPGQSGNHPGRQ